MFCDIFEKYAIFCFNPVLPGDFQAPLCLGHIVPVFAIIKDTFFFCMLYTITAEVEEAKLVPRTLTSIKDEIFLLLAASWFAAMSKGRNRTEETEGILLRCSPR